VTIIELISHITTSNKWVSTDADITPRFIFNLIRTKLSVLMSQQVNRRRLTNSDSIFYTEECLELCKVAATECGVSTCNTVRRSVEKLPKLEEGIYSYTIQGVYNIENNEEIKPTTNREIINRSKLRYKSVDLFYLIKDQYLYIMDENIEAVNIYYFTTDIMKQLKGCQSAYSLDFKFPGFLEDAMYNMVYSELQVYHNSRKDKTQDNDDQGT